MSRDSIVLMSLWLSEGVTKSCYNLQECSALESGCLVKVDENGFFIYWKSEGKVIVYIFFTGISFFCLDFML